MSSGSFPKPQLKYIDLGAYGGEGTLAIKPLGTGAKAKITEQLRMKAMKEMPELLKDQDAFVNAYGMTFSVMAIQECVIDAPGIDKEHPKLPTSVIDDFSEKLTEDILNAISELSDFPLVQNAGEALKQEQ